MGYRRTETRTLTSIEVSESHDYRHHPPGKRRKKEKPTPEAMKRANRKRREREALALMRNNFLPGDYWVTLTWGKERRPETMEEARREVSNFILRLKRSYRKRGGELRYMGNLEAGPRGAYHLHIVVNELMEDEIPLAASLIANAWRNGAVKDAKPLREEGLFKDLARYLTKTEETDPKKVKESHFLRSRNLKKPQREVKLYRRRSIMNKAGAWKEIIPPPGYYLDKESVYEGTDIFGFPCRHYSLLKIQVESRSGKERRTGR